MNYYNFELYKDAYNIYNLITKIDKAYRLVFDKKEKIFKVINIAKNNQICLKTTTITSNIIKKLQISRIENINKIIKFIDENNDLILQKNRNLFKANVNDKMVECIKFSKRASNISNSDIKKIIGEKIC